MADPSPQQNLTIIVNDVIDITQVPTISGPIPPQKELPQASEDDFDFLPEPRHGTTDHVEPNSWADWVKKKIQDMTRRKQWSTSYIIRKRPIREPIFWNLDRGKDFLSRMHDNRDWSSLWAQHKAIVLQIVGTLAETACFSCRNGYGLFTSCVVVDDLMGGSCANCCGNRATRCSFFRFATYKQTETPRQDRGAMKRNRATHGKRGHWSSKYAESKLGRSVHITARAARGRLGNQKSMTQLNLGFENILSAIESETLKSERVKVVSNMQSVNDQVETFLKEMRELTIIGMECDEDVIMQSVDEADNAIVINDDEDVTGGVIKMETAEPRGIKTESSKWEGDVKPEIKKDKQNIDGDTCEHKGESDGNVHIKEEN